MAAKRCPLCGGNVRDNYCDSCGYSLPDEEDISALYNYDPSDYPQEQPAVREITPEHITEEIYPNRPKPMEFKVREEPKNDTPFVNPYANQNNGANTGGASPYANNAPKQSGNQSPYAGPYINNAPPQNNNQQNNQNPYANGNFKPYANPNQNASGESFWDFLKKYWIFALLTFFLPPIWGVIWLIYDRNTLSKKYKTYIIILTILGLILPP